jgi:hypothetical protein
MITAPTLTQLFGLQHISGLHHTQLTFNGPFTRHSDVIDVDSCQSGLTKFI